MGSEKIPEARALRIAAASGRLYREQHRPEPEMNYFAYGSNMHGAGMAVRCPEAKPLGIARLADHRFRINRRGVATVVPEPGATVHGVLWLVTEDCLSALDRYEGVARGFYRRLTGQVTVSDHDSREAFLYHAADSEPGRAPWAYLDIIVRGAREAGLPAEYVAELEQWR